jgi:hypothetical protein
LLRANKRAAGSSLGWRGGTIRVVAIRRWDTFPLASMSCESLINRRVVLTGFSRIRGRLRGGEAMHMKEFAPEEVVHRSR